MYAKPREGLDKNIALCVFLVELMSYPHMQHEILISIPFLTFATMASSLVIDPLPPTEEEEKEQVKNTNKAKVIVVQKPEDIQKHVFIEKNLKIRDLLDLVSRKFHIARDLIHTLNIPTNQLDGHLWEWPSIFITGILFQRNTEAEQSCPSSIIVRNADLFNRLINVMTLDKPGCVTGIVDLIRYLPIENHPYAAILQQRIDGTSRQDLIQTLEDNNLSASDWWQAQFKVKPDETPSIYIIMLLVRRTIKQHPT